MQQGALLLLMSLLCACARPDWVPWGVGAPESPECQHTTTRLGCENHPHMWVVATIERVITYKDHDNPIADCGEAIVMTNSCGWYRATLRVQDVIVGEVPETFVRLVGELGEWCRTPEFKSGPYLMTIFKRDGQHREGHLFELSSQHGRMIVDSNDFVLSFAVEDRIRQLANEDGRIPLGQLKEFALPSLCE